MSIRTPDLSGISEGTVLICVADPFRNPDTVKASHLFWHYIDQYGYDTKKAV